MLDQEIFYEGKVHSDYKKKALLNTFVRTIMSLLPMFFMISMQFFIIDLFSFNIASLITNLFIMSGIAIIIIVIVMIIANFYYKIYIKNFSFKVTDNDVVINHGVFRQVRASVPYCRIQNISINNTIFERRYNISSINIETAGTSNRRYRAYGGYRRRYAHGEGFIVGQKDPTYIETLLKEKITICLKYMEGTREGTVL